MTRATFNTWLKDARLLGQEDDEYIVGVRNDYAKDWLENRLYDTILRTLSAIVHRPVSLRFVVWSDEIIADPPAIFLDEPTTGLDPRGRLALWQQIRDIRDAGAAVVLTTQYLEEADQLADYIVVIDRGAAVAAGTTAELKARLERDVLQVTVDDPQRLADAIAALGADSAIAIDEHTVHLAVASAAEGLAALRRVDDAGVTTADFQLRRPTLDDVFIEITGEPVSHVEEVPQEASR